MGRPANHTTNGALRWLGAVVEELLVDGSELRART
jgi:hypothetical protein